MGIPADIPHPTIALVLPEGDEVTMIDLCNTAKVKCKVTGLSARRPLRMALAEELAAVRLPGSLSPVWLGVPRGTPQRRALLALGLLAFGVFDYAARETLRGIPEARATASPGRPRTGKALSPAERQRRHRRLLLSGND